MVSQPPTSKQYDWLQAGALSVAPALLGWELVTRAGNVETAGRIVEVEAYLGFNDPHLIAAGPGRLTQTPGIQLSDTGTILGGRIALRAPTIPTNPNQIVAGPRIGVSTAKDMPWRFYLDQNSFVSRR